MREEEKRRLTVIEKTEEKVQETESVKSVSRHTNPITKKLLEYRREKEKFSVIDLLRGK